MAKIGEENGQVLHRSSYQVITQKDWEQEECKLEQSLLIKSLHQMQCPCAEVTELVELGVENTPQYDPYEKKSKNDEMFPILDEEPKVIPAWGDQYVHSEILLLRGYRMARGQVVCLKHDANGNLIGRSNQNPILNTCLYEV